MWESGNISARFFYQYNCTDFFFSFIFSLMLSPTFLLSSLGLQTRINLNNKIGLISLNLFSFDWVNTSFWNANAIAFKEKETNCRKKSFLLDILFLFLFSYRKSKCCLHIFIITFCMHTIWRIFNISWEIQSRYTRG